MIGLLKKNFYCGKSTLRFLIIISAIVGAAVIIAAAADGSTIISAVMSTLCTLGFALVVSEENISSDKICGWNKYIRTMPVSVSAAMLAQYIYAAVIVLASGIASLIISFLCGLFCGCVGEPDIYLPVAAMTTIVFFMLAVDIPLISHFSAMAASLMKIGVFIVIAAIVGFWALNDESAKESIYNGFMYIVENGKVIIMLSPLGGLGLMALSWLVSCKTGFKT